MKIELSKKNDTIVGTTKHHKMTLEMLLVNNPISVEVGFDELQGGARILTSIIFNEALWEPTHHHNQPDISAEEMCGFIQDEAEKVLRWGSTPLRATDISADVEEKIWDFLQEEKIYLP